MDSTLASTHPNEETPSLNRARRAALGSFAGAVVDWYDFLLYGITAALVFNREFFPQVSPAMGTLAAFATFGVGFLFRPLGGVIFGHFGDRLGRKRMLMLTVWMMGIATALIGILPSFSAIGWWAPVLLVTLRAIQGFAVGGEWGGAALLSVESAPKNKKAFYSSGVQVGYGVGLLLSTGLVSLISQLTTDEQFLSWGWRIPFFLALPMGVVALWLRVSMEETPSFVQQQEKPLVAQADTIATVKAIMMGIGRVMVWSAAGYTYLVIMPTYLQSALHTGFNQALLIAVISNIGFALTIIPSGILSDRIGRRTVMIIATVLLLLLALPLLKILQAESSTLAVKAVVVLIAGGLVGMLAGPGPAMLSEMFPTRVRYTGLGLAYSLSNAIFSGCAGLIITGLIKQTGNLDIPAYYVMATAVVSIVALLTLRKDDHLRSLEE